MFIIGIAFGAGLLIIIGCLFFEITNPTNYRQVYIGKGIYAEYDKNGDFVRHCVLVNNKFMTYKYDSKDPILK